ncbi:MAG: acyl-CoA dehydrogenase, partial [Nitriliruptorales bacterium]|nr:acyl-CoA dehydrogenase [Nitriliruptorales bacterium]
GEIQSFAKGDAGNGHLAVERERLGAALDEVQGMLGTLVGFLDQDIYLAGLNTTPFLFALAELVIGWLLLRQADVAAFEALRATDLSDDDRAFYDGKAAAARWFTANVLPKMAAHRAAMDNTDLGVMELDDAAF